MRAVVQRVSRASVTVDGEITGQIEQGFLVLLGVEQSDTQDDVIYLAQKSVGLRVFEDSEGKMNLSLADVHGKMLVVSHVAGGLPEGASSQFCERGATGTGKRVVRELRGRSKRARHCRRNGAFPGTYGCGTGE